MGIVGRFALQMPPQMPPQTKNGLRHKPRGLLKNIAKTGPILDLKRFK